ncbi:MAG: Na(+) H(+) antiporter subunit D, partial [uncultured Acidimicrobiales bacterium]
ARPAPPPRRPAAPGGRRLARAAPAPVAATGARPPHPHRRPRRVDRPAPRGAGRRHRGGGRRRVGGAHRHHPGGRPARRDHAGHRHRDAARRPRLRHRAPRHRGHPPLLPPDVPGAGRRRVARLPHRGPVQPVRGVRDHAHRQLRPHHPRRVRAAGAVRDDVRRLQPAVVHAVRDSRRPRLRRHRHREPGRPRRPPRRHRPGDPQRPGAHAARRVRGQGRHLPALLVAARQLPHGAVPGHGDLRRLAHEGRGLRHHPHPDAAVPRRRGLRGPPRDRGADDGGRRPRGHRTERREAHPQLPHRQPDRLHDPRPRPVQRGRHRRRHLLHRPPHRREDDAVPRQRVDRGERRDRRAQPAERPHAPSARRRRAVRPAGAVARRHPALLRVRRQAGARPGRSRHRPGPGHRGQPAGQPPHPVLDDEDLGGGVLGRAERGRGPRRRRRRPGAAAAPADGRRHRSAGADEPRHRVRRRAPLRPLPRRSHRAHGAGRLRRGGARPV